MNAEQRKAELAKIKQGKPTMTGVKLTYQRPFQVLCKR